jgi:hypothetical protein
MPLLLCAGPDSKPPAPLQRMYALNPITISGIIGSPGCKGNNTDVRGQILSLVTLSMFTVQPTRLPAPVQRSFSISASSFKVGNTLNVLAI